MNLLNGVSFFLPPPPLLAIKERELSVIHTPLNDHNDHDEPFLAGFSVAALVVVAGAICDNLLVGGSRDQQDAERVFCRVT